MVSEKVASAKRPARLRRYMVSEVVFTVIILVMALICIVPIWHIVALSLSGREAVLSRQVSLWPMDLDFNAYISVFSDQTMQAALIFSVILTAIYTVLAMIGSILFAYPLSKKDLPGQKFLMVFALIPMYFAGGTIPEYLWMKQLSLIDNPLSLLLPVLISTYNTIILRNFFASIPSSLEESAYLDGCNDFGVLIRIVLPLSTASLATIALFYAVTRWNNFADVRYYINSSKFYTLQMKLYQVVFNSTDTEVNMLEGGRNAVLSETIRSAAIIFSTVPIIIVYPFLQKYFVKGVMIGAVKE